MKKTIKNKKILIAAGLVVVVAGGFLGYRAITKNKTATTQYLTAQVRRGNIVVTVSGTGQVLASNQTNIEPQVSGTVVSVPVVNNESVSAGETLVELDPTNDERAARDAQTSLQNSQLALETLEAPAATSTILQDQEAVAKAGQTLATDQANLTADYTNAYADISTAFIDLSNLVNGLNNILYDKNINPTQGDVYAYDNLISNINQNASVYSEDAILSYQTALANYNQSLADYKNSNIDSSTSTVEILLNETNDTLKSVSIANTNLKSLLDLVNTTLEQNNDKVPPALTADETTLESYITTTNSELSTISDIQNSIEATKQSLGTDNLSISQTQAALAQLEDGPTALAIQTQELAVTQAQNALDDAKQNLANDTVRAPFAGVITNITAKIGQPVSPSTILGVLLSNKQLAQATLNEVDVVNVKVGQKALITLDALPNFTATGKVSEVDTLGTVSQGIVSYNVQVALDSPNPLIKPGMSDTINIVTNEKQNVLLVPNSAVTTRQNKSYVKTTNSSGNPTETPVVTGLSNDVMTEIVSGLSEGDTVVTQTIAATASGAAPVSSPASGSSPKTPGGFGGSGLLMRGGGL